MDSRDGFVVVHGPSWPHYVPAGEKAGALCDYATISLRLRRPALWRVDSEDKAFQILAMRFAARVWIPGTAWVVL